MHSCLKELQLAVCQIDDSQTVLCCHTDGLRGTARFAVKIADEQGGGVDHKAIARRIASGVIIAGQGEYAVGCKQTMIEASLPFGRVAVGLTVKRNGTEQLYRQCVSRP